MTKRVLIFGHGYVAQHLGQFLSSTNNDEVDITSRHISALDSAQRPYIPKAHEKTEILNPRFDQIFNASLTPIVRSTEGKEADEKMIEDGDSKVGNLMGFGYNIIPFDGVDNLDQYDVIISTVPPDKNNGQVDPVLQKYGKVLKHTHQHVIYISSTSVYGNHDGAWIDERSACYPKTQTSLNRFHAEKLWQKTIPYALILRISGIYGPQQSMVERVLNGTATRLISDVPFARIHIDDICAVIGLMIKTHQRKDIFNLADDYPCPTGEVIEFTCDQLGLPYPQLESPLTLTSDFYKDSKRTSNKKLKRVLHYALKFPTYKEGIRDILLQRNSKN